MGEEYPDTPKHIREALLIIQCELPPPRPRPPKKAKKTLKISKKRAKCKWNVTKICSFMRCVAFSTRFLILFSFGGNGIKLFFSIFWPFFVFFSTPAYKFLLVRSGKEKKCKLRGKNIRGNLRKKICKKKRNKGTKNNKGDRQRKMENKPEKENKKKKRGTFQT